MLVVEGPDGSGKSALVERLRSTLGMPVAPKVVSSDTEALVDLAAWTEANVAKGFQRTIFDRHRLISEPIYGPILRPTQDSNFMDLGWMNEMTWRFYQARPIIVYCLPSFDEVVANVNREETDNSAVADSIAAIYTAYVNRATLDFTRGVGRLHNYKTNMFVDTLRWVKFKLEEEDERTRSSRLPVNSS